MNVRTLWENGVFRPLEPLTLKHSQVTIQISDEEIAVNDPSPLPTYDLAEFPEEIQQNVARMRAMREETMSMRLPDDLPEETEEQQQRSRAFELRREQGRPV